MESTIYRTRSNKARIMPDTKTIEKISFATEDGITVYAVVNSTFIRFLLYSENSAFNSIL
ncbi:MAG: hypothetical protein HFP81_04140 [Methylococcales symbiont of Hymedesmia sp. n. MRB-2018]|nr:MAG: hypothetical protein HFP81_04140 [Methylococcales symbiont of Hymedesmia sp. n. MRB-2018]